jgi:putative intracellular protease/amidase
MITRRQFAAASAMLAAMQANHPAFGQAAHGEAAGATTTPSHDMSAMPAHWTGKEQIAFLIYPEFTALDMVGPHHMLTSLMGATTHLVAKSREIVKSDAGLMFQPSATFDDCPADLDIICVPGGTEGTLAAIQDDATLRFLKDRGSRAKYVTSVCTGSLILGAAGLLTGYRATSHWVARSLLPIFGAIPAEGRVVRDRNRITGGGVTAGIDFGLALVGQLRDREYAEGVQLLAEYAPEPPYDAGTPQRAPANVTAMMGGMFTEFNEKTARIARDVYARHRSG